MTKKLWSLCTIYYYLAINDPLLRPGLNCHLGTTSAEVALPVLLWVKFGLLGPKEGDLPVGSTDQVIPVVATLKFKFETFLQG